MHPELLVVADGWDHDGWVGPFYPDDLPGDWRLGYYANAFRGVLVPAATVAGAHRGTAEGWLEDTPAGFRFVLEVDPERPPATYEEVVTALGERLAGVVTTAPGKPPAVPPGVPLAAPGGGAPGVDPVWQDHGPGLGSWFGRVPGVPPSGRPCRDLLERFLAVAAGRPRGVLVFPALAETPGRLAEARVIAELLGA